MKILATTTTDLTTDQRMARICGSLAKAGHEVLLVGRHLSGSMPLVERPFRQKRLRLFFQKGKMFYLEYNLRLFLFLLFQKHDLVWSVDLDSLLPGLLVSRLRGKKCVYDAHEYFTELPELVERPAVKRAWEMVANFAIPRLRFACTVGGCLAAEMERKYGVKFEVIRNLPFQRNLPPGPVFPKEKPFVLLYQGALNDGRGLEETIAAMPLLVGVELWLAGEGDLSGLLRDLAKKMGVENKVKFLGRLAPEDLAELTPQAHLGLNLLKNKGLNYYFSLANKAFDYIQAGIPSLSMDFPEYRQLNEEHGVFLLLETLSAEAVADAVNRLRSHETAYRQMAGNCRKAAPLLTWEVEEKALLEFIGKVV